MSECVCVCVMFGSRSPLLLVCFSFVSVLPSFFFSLSFFLSLFLSLYLVSVSVSVCVAVSGLNLFPSSPFQDKRCVCM